MSEAKVLAHIIAPREWHVGAWDECVLCRPSLMHPAYGRALSTSGSGPDVFSSTMGHINALPERGTSERSLD